MREQGDHTRERNSASRCVQRPPASGDGATRGSERHRLPVAEPASNEADLRRQVHEFLAATSFRPRIGRTRDDLIVAGLAVQPVHTCADVTPEDLISSGALARAVQIAGSTRRCLELTVRYAQERQQFGRSISRFQAVQQQIAILAAEVFVVDVSARAAVASQGTAGAALAAAAAKYNASRSAWIICRIAHQVHGALGIAQEYDLHLSTTRMWSWASEFGSARHWAEKLGEWSATLDPWEYRSR